MKEESTATRLKKALELRGMKQAELVDKTGIGKSSISTYLAGSYEPKQRNIYKMAQVLNVDPTWLMGYNVPMEVDQNLEQIADFTVDLYKDKQLQRLVAYYSKLSNSKKELAIDIIKTISEQSE